MQHFPGMVIEGARQVGKSTLARQIADNDAVIMNLDDEQTRAAAIADPVGFIRQAGERQLVIDEMQRMPELTLVVKSEIDNNRIPGRFILTGSARLLRVRGTADSLAGRVARLTLYGLSRGELAQQPDDFITAIIGNPNSIKDIISDTTRDSLTKILAMGAYPEIRDYPDRLRNTWIDSYLEGLINRDITELRSRVDPSRALSLLRTIAGRPAAELVKATLAQGSAIPAATVTSYLDLLHEIGLVVSIPPWTPNLAKREIGRPKILVTDSGLALRLARMTPAQLSHISNSESFGAYLEAFVVTELLKQQGWSDQDYTVFHYRDRDGDEVDIIIELADGFVIGIEVKAASAFSSKHFSGLIRMRDRLGERFLAGVVLAPVSTGYRYADRLFGAPIDALWNFLG